jgi:alkylated DNA nucleotide flippase Atl1
MAKPKKSWREKLLDAKGLPKTGPIDERMTKRWGAGTMVIPAPIEVDEVMRRVPKGRVATIDEIRKALARKHRVTIACPLTTGIFAWIAAHAAGEAENEGARRITPYWRTLKSGGEINAKYPGGVESVRARLEAEGHRVVRKGKRWFVEGWEGAVARMA